MAGFTTALVECRDAALVGGKAVNLGRLMRAGFPVPGGFVVNTLAYRLACGRSSENVPGELPAEVAEEIRGAYGAMGAGAVAVRSSATAEDMAQASMAGQYDTFLDIEGEEALLDAVRRCWAGLDSPRTRAYLQTQGIAPSRVAMAVVVQRLISADVAGVLFTANPNAAVGAACGREMLLEASWGLGESVVSGRVQPDVLRLEEGSGRVLEATIADKQSGLFAGEGEARPVDEVRRRMPCLRGRDVQGLWQLGRRTAEHFGVPQDIEWAIRGEEFYLLQARPITTRVAGDDRAEVLRETRRHLEQELAAGRGPWVVHNLGETLAHPTMLTWSVIGDFMSGAGGYGNLYRLAGFEPGPKVMAAGFLERVGGRIYMDASRAAEMFFADFPYAYDVEMLRRSAEAAQSPPTLPRGTAGARAAVHRRLRQVNEKLAALAGRCDRNLREALFPRMMDYVAAAGRVDLTRLTAGEWTDLWKRHEAEVLDTFGPQSLLPSLICGMALDALRRLIADYFWEEDAAALAQQISSGGVSNLTLLADAELFEVARGERPLETWLADHGHRAPGEFDLASPRWREMPEKARDMAGHLAKGESPLARHRRNAAQVQQKIDGLRGRLPAGARRELDRAVELVRRYVAFREDGKDYLMRGYGLLRGLALEAGRRLEIGEQVFHLTRAELLEAMAVGYAPLQLIEQRVRQYRAEAQLTLPQVIDAGVVAAWSAGAASHTLDGSASAPANGVKGADPGGGADGHKAFAISTGIAGGPARILTSPIDTGDLGTGYVLVCPSTDPSWTPLFVNAAALVLECGGTLSHGAVVAREMGLPAVVLANATRLFAAGERIQVDGVRGWVGPLPDACAPGAAKEEVVAPVQAVDVSEVSVARELIPPPAGAKDRRAARIGAYFAGVWGVFLLAFFLLPRGWVYGPTLAVLDLVLWPLVRIVGKPATVAIVAAGVAMGTLLIQKFMTDNRRLREAKRRAGLLQREAKALPLDAPRRAVLLRLAGAVPLRTLMAAMVPVGILLGPMLMPFVWFKQRVDPAAWNAAVGSPVQIVATVDSHWTQPLLLEVPAGVGLDESTPATRTLPALRPVLERLLALYQSRHADPTLPWELAAAPDVARQETIAELQHYLDAGIPPQGMTWQLRPPVDFDGRFDVAIDAAGYPPAIVHVVLGEKNPPAEALVPGTAGSPIRELRVVYPRTAQAAVFFRPLHFVAGFPGIPAASKLGAWDIGWLGLYILAYLPVLLAARLLLKVA